MSKETHSGGCQCGAVRFRVDGDLARASVCHCRMCQKAFGAFYAPLVQIAEGAPTWTRGKPKHFQSSNFVARGFCEACGTPLTYEAPDGIGLAIGAFDHPEAVKPVVQWGVEAKIPFVDELPSLPAKHTLDDANAVHFLSQLVSYQHPDHDTETWPAK